jgi:protoheme IX farnesyltransferase
MTEAIESPDNTLLESTPRDWWVLTKPGVMMLVLFSGAVGMWLAPGSLNPVLQLSIILAIGMASASGAICNMVYDQDIDRIMKRTQNRPLITGVIAADDAKLLAGGLAIGSVTLMGLVSNWYAAALLAFSIFFYAVIYTVWLKRHTPQNIVIGGAAGAFPPVIGWLAVTGDASSALPWLLFLTIFLWTPPHFWALALYRNEDYRNANIPMMPVTAGKKHTKGQMIGYCIILLITTLAVPFTSPTLGISSLLAATFLSGMFLIHSLRVWRSDEDSVARKMFGYSILYLFALMGAFLLDHLLLPF